VSLEERIEIMDKDAVSLLQERNYAQTKLALLRAAIAKIQTRPLSDISVKEICEAAGVTETAFYQHFPKKTDLLLYYFQVIGLEASWYLQHGIKHKTALEMVEACFDFMSRKLAAEPLMMTETIAHFAQERQPPDFIALSQAERILAFPNLTGIDALEIADARIETLIKPYLVEAIRAGELPADSDLDATLVLCLSGFVGLVMSLHLTEPALIRPLCRRQLRLFWNALRHEAATVQADR
jgi:AcrR family transcriptional regulator